ncbi:MAG: hypothetical protein NTV34_05505 [Proteobacteria bacterium]|nr:hypothetical protein [Pseudomonadota bacterium]
MHIYSVKASSLLIVGLLVGTIEVANAEESYTPCVQDSVKQQLRSSELRQLEKADQNDRLNGQILPGVDIRDRERRQRVGQIFGEGCFKSGDDFASAALIYQHGGDLYFDPHAGQPRALAPDQIFQAFLWSTRATELGTDSKWLTAAAVDRYLWFTGHKQLFGTQGSKVNMNDRCWCLVPTEVAFPDSTRTQYTGLTLVQALEHTQEFPGQPSGCEPTYCAFNLQGSPQGTVPGFW